MALRSRMLGLEDRILNVRVPGPNDHYKLSKGFCLVSGERKSKFESDPQDYMRYRKAIEGELNQRFRLVWHTQHSQDINAHADVLPGS